MSRKLIRGLFFGLALLLCAGGCGDDDEGTKTEPPDTFAPPPTGGPANSGDVPPVTAPKPPMR